MKLNLPQNKEKIDLYMKHQQLYIKEEDVRIEIQLMQTKYEELLLLIRDNATLEDFNAIRQEVIDRIAEIQLASTRGFGVIMANGVQITADLVGDVLNLTSGEGIILNTDAETNSVEIVNSYHHPEDHSVNMITENSDRVFITSTERNNLYGYVYEQNAASSVWVIPHPLNKHPSVTVVDSGGNVSIGKLTYNSSSLITVSFSAEFSGVAYLS